MTDDIVVDFRVQPPYRSIRNLHFHRTRPKVEDPVSGNPFRYERETPASFNEASMERFVEEMEEAGVGHAVIMGQRCADEWGNAENVELASLVDSYPGRFTAFGGIDPRDPNAAKQTSEAIHGLGMKGIAVVPGWCDPPLKEDDDELREIYAICQEAGVPVMITASHFIGPDMMHAHPVSFQRAALRYPELVFIMGHGGWPWTLAACSAAMRSTNIYLMPEFYMYLPNMPGAQDYVDAANSFLKTRMLFSSCYPSNSLKNALNHVGRLELESDARMHFLGGNASRLLGLD